MKKLNFKAVIFDMDGVITNTAKVHSTAWKKMFDAFLERYSKKHNLPFLPFDDQTDYINYVDGKPRLEGIKSFLKSRNIELEMGSSIDKITIDSVHALGNWKNAFFTETVKSEGPEVFESSLKLIKQLKSMGIKTAVATSSKNADLILSLAKLKHLFGAQVDGVNSEKLGLKGKPHPDIFVEAAKQLGIDPSDCVMVEDAISGVKAGYNGNFGFIIGVSREFTGDDLSINGADIVVRDLGEITVEEINNWFTNGLLKNNWYIKYQGFKPKEEKLRSVLCALGNGYMCNLAAIESSKSGPVNYPATYMANLFNKLPTKIHDKNIYNNDIVNIPNWTLIKFRINNGNFIEPLKEEIISYQQGLDMHRGLMKRRIIIKDKTGRITKIHSMRIVSMDNPHIATIKYQITPLNYKGNITLKSSIDADIINDGVKRYSDLNQKHIKFLSSGKLQNGIYLTAQTTSSKIQIAISAKHIFECKTKVTNVSRNVVIDKNKISEEISFDARDTHSYVLEKIVSIHKSNDEKTKNPLFKSKNDLKKITSFKNIYITHVNAWNKIWSKIDIKIKGDRFAQKTLRLHMFHLMSSYSHHNIHTDASIGARGLHGEAYRGHIFWDELFIQPFYNMHCPNLTKSMLMYRYKRLDAARAYAKENKYSGAMYPWQTADDGSEETQIVHFNPVSGDWKPDNSCRQRHVNIAIFYNIYKYIEFSNDIKFLNDYGAEMMLDIAKYWSSISKLGDDKKYHISGVMGPDEYHEKLPSSKEYGLKDNAYTNIMVVWLLEKTHNLKNIISKQKYSSLIKKLGINNAELKKWEDIQNKMFVPIKNSLIEQFDGYMSLKELDFHKLRDKYKNIKRVDRLLKAQSDNPDNYKVAKQADTLMTFFLLRPIEVKNILLKLGYDLGDEIQMLKKHYDYYEKRTSHDSTLSMVVHSIISKLFADKEIVWDWFLEALISDVKDTQGGTTQEGIHAGVMAGTIDIFYRNFAGISFENEILNINPNLPEHWKNISFKLTYKNVWYNISINKELVTVSYESNHKTRLIAVNGKNISLSKNKHKEIKLN